MKYVDLLWRVFWEHAAPEPGADLSAEQVKIVRSVFFTGAWSVLEYLEHAMSDGPDLTEDDKALVLSVRAELEEFAKTLEGQANAR